MKEIQFLIIRKGVATIMLKNEWNVYNRDSNPTIGDIPFEYRAYDYFNGILEPAKKCRTIQEYNYMKDRSHDVYHKIFFSMWRRC